MKVNGDHYHSIWYDKNLDKVKIIDQRLLPYEFKIITLETLKDFENAISDMAVRGAPLIGATAAFGIARQMLRDPSNKNLDFCWDKLIQTRPTAINLKWALDRCRSHLLNIPIEERGTEAMKMAVDISNEDIEINKKIGLNGVEIIKSIAKSKPSGEPVNLLTHCNAGWLATVDWGTATSPMYQAHDLNIPIHVWVDETRPRNQGALTAWELKSHGISHNYITDNAGGHLIQHGFVDMVIVGTDRTTSKGDVCNKIGTYLKALAAKDNNIPFYVALPSPTIDWTIEDGINEIPIEERSESEVSLIQGKDNSGSISKLKITPDGTIGSNPSFDVTPAKLNTGLINEKGICKAYSDRLRNLFPNNN